MMETRIVTAKTLTNAQIRSLRTESLDAADYAMAAICDLALDGTIDTDDYSALEAHEARLVGSMTRDEAIEKVVRVLRAAAAMGDE